MKAIGIDVGGMSIKIGVVDEKGNILSKERFVPDYSKDGTITFKALAEFIKPLFLRYGDIMGIGVGLPGFVNPETNVCECCTNIKSWVNVPVGEIFETTFGRPCLVGNDANLAMLGEACFGAAKKCKNAVLLTLGTGVGSGFFFNGKLFTGTQGKGAEFGHTILVKDGRPCNCGRKGCVEAYCSATALKKETRKAMMEDRSSMMWDKVDGDINKAGGRLAIECEKLGDATAKKVVDEYISYLGEATTDVINLFRPEVIIYGGGISEQKENLIKKLSTYLDQHGWGCDEAYCPKPELMVSNLGNDAGILGAAGLILFPDKR